MGIAGRVKRLEQFHRITECPVCHGEPPFEVSYVNEDEPAPSPTGCPHCNEARHIIVRYVQEALPGSPEVESSKLSARQLAELHR
jgi:hypothetical protein